MNYKILSCTKQNKKMPEVITCEFENRTIRLTCVYIVYSFGQVGPNLFYTQPFADTWLWFWSEQFNFGSQFSVIPKVSQG